MKTKITELTNRYFNEIIAWRRHLHAHPELSNHEVETAKFVTQKLQSFGLTVQTQIAGNGVVALLQGDLPHSRCVALRADMDALPITEANQVTYASKYPGIMHACGHDVHTANLLGIAKILSELKPFVEGTIKFIFQPSEEKIPSGAQAMIAAGVLKNPTPDAILGLHVSPEIEVGKIGFHAGKFMASSDEIYITVTGKGGHAAQLQQTINPLFVAAEILLALKQFSDATLPVVLNFGKIEGKGATNVIPDTVEIAGTLRCFDEQLRFQLHEKIKTTTTHIAAQSNAIGAVQILEGYPVLVNNETLTAHSQQSIAQIIGAENCINVPQRMGSEDFAYYSHQIPACFLRLGVGNAAQGITAPIHTPNFNIDETAFKTSVAAMVHWALHVEV
ncbi:MAG: M20 family metallopeptidase [Chitinophagales bacterium]